MTKSFQQQVVEERARQVQLGYDAAHDDAHGVDPLIKRAQQYELKGDFVKGTALRQAAEDVKARRKARQPK